MSSDVRRMIGALALLLASTMGASGAVKPGSTLPALATFGLEGRLPELAGQVLVVDFWASWCAPCKASFPALQRLQNEFRARGVKIIAVNVDTKRDAMDRFLADHPVTFTVVRDAANRLVETVEPEAMPTSLVIDRKGRVFSLHTGYRGEETEKALREEIEKCLRSN